MTPLKPPKLYNNRTFPRGAQLPTCPAGHTTCWPDSCPVCRAAVLGRRVEPTRVQLVATGKRLARARREHYQRRAVAVRRRMAA